jgi:hypothetical protein
MHFLDAWTGLSPADLIRFALPVGCLAVAAFVPGRLAARLSAVGLALSMLLLPELGGTPALTFGWVVLWLLVAWQAGRSLAPARQPQETRLGGLEAATVALMLAPALLVLMVSVVARLDLPPEAGRRASYGLLLITLGVLHLMLRRHALRATVAFAALGLGVQLLEGTARASAVGGTQAAGGLVLLGTALAVALVARLAHGRERQIGTAWVNDAHDLRD